MGTISEDLKIEDLGYPGTITYLSILGKENEDNTSAQERFRDKSRREFRFNCVLGKGFENTNKIDLSIDSSGDSLLIMSEDMAKLQIETPLGNFTIKKNEKNRASNILYSCIVNTREEAEILMKDHVIPLVDNLSYRYNVPIFIDRVIGWDVKNRVFFSSIMVPYSYKPIKQGDNVFFHDMKPIYALFREAKTSNSYYYKYLCFYKILEGIYDHIRINTFKEAKSNGIELDTVDENVPNNKFLAEVAGEYIGESIYKLYKGYFRTEFRNNIAHFLLNNEEPININLHSFKAKTESNIILIELSALKVIENENYYTSQLPSKTPNK